MRGRHHADEFLRRRPKGGHALAILPGLTHYNLGMSPLFATVTLSFADALARTSEEANA